jgi:hypothetical protein
LIDPLADRFSAPCLQRTLNGSQMLVGERAERRNVLQAFEGVYRRDAGFDFEPLTT